MLYNLQSVILILLILYAVGLIKKIASRNASGIGKSIERMIKIGRLATSFGRDLPQVLVHRAVVWTIAIIIKLISSFGRDFQFLLPPLLIFFQRFNVLCFFSFKREKKRERHLAIFYPSIFFSFTWFYMRQNPS